jgi:hypothetical protein
MIPIFLLTNCANVSVLALNEREEVIRRGDIVYGIGDLKDLSQWVTSYLGNGHLGACFDHLGTMGVDGSTGSPSPIGGTYFCGLYHFVHAKYGMDYALPIARLQVSQDGVSAQTVHTRKIEAYDQRLSLSDGVLRTRLTLDSGLTLQREQFFSQLRKNLFVMRTGFSAPEKATFEIQLRPVVDALFHYGQDFHGKVGFRRKSDVLAWKISTGDATTSALLLVDSGENGETSSIDDGVKVVAEGDGEILIWLALVSDRESEDPQAEAERIVRAAQADGYRTVLHEHTEWWKEYWDESLISLPPAAEDVQKLWLRGNCYLGCSLSDLEAPHPPLVFGLAEVGWPSYFPQDFLFLYQNALSANHLRHAASTAGFWLDILHQAREYAQRMFGLPGAYYPWTPPLFLWDDYHRDGVPNNCYYEHHNQAYVARMVWDYAEFTGDREFLRGRAYPVLREIAHLYRAMMSVDPETGAYEIRFTPSKGQDEYAPGSQANYFDCLLSAEYSLRKAAECSRHLGVDEGLRREWEQTLKTGLAYSKLISGDLYVAYEGDDRGGGSEKHPVQLNPIALLPVGSLAADPRVHNAYRRRYEITLGYDRHEAHAWTLGEFLLASSRMRDVEGFREDLRRLRTCNLVDPRLIQVFESSGRKPHFMTTQGLIMEAITECFVQWWKGEIEIWPLLLPEWLEASRDHPIRFESLRAPGGFLISGRVSGSSEEAEIWSELGEPLRVRVPSGWGEGLLLGEEGRPLARGTGGDLITLDTRPGGLYRLVKSMDSQP